MLLSIDDLDACWSKATSWLQRELNCHRVDAGFGTASSHTYFPGIAQAKNPNYDVPSFEGAAVLNHDPAMQAMWWEKQPVVFADIKDDQRVTAYLRKRISGARTKSKFGTALRTHEGGYGLTVQTGPNILYRMTLISSIVLNKLWWMFLAQSLPSRSKFQITENSRRKLQRLKLKDFTR